ncbi:MAG: hypothetical protein JSW41_04615 [Candidatus Aenigmatarchaeota archaeon]|nr:MAG: hypothetical protein JSW41_04615 [Candidatus Aenigmarchaeota archaeon]
MVHSSEDKVKLKEIELQTQYELKYLSQSFNDFKRYVTSRFDSETDKFNILNKKVNWLMLITFLMLAGADGEALLNVIKVIS